MIRQYLGDIVDDHKTQGEWKGHSGNEVIDYKTQWKWKIQLTMIINFVFSKDSDEIRTMHTKSNNIETMMGNKTDGIIAELFEYLLQKYQEGLEEKNERKRICFS